MPAADTCRVVRTRTVSQNGGSAVLGSHTAARTTRLIARNLHRPGQTADPGQSVVDLLRFQTSTDSVLVCLPAAEFTLQLANELIAVSVERRIPVGVLPLPSDLVSLSDLLAATATAPRGDLDRAPHRALLYCDFVDDRPDAADEDSFGRHDSSGFFARLLEGCEAAVIHAHGNGYDFRIGERVLCAKVRHPHPWGKPARHLPCWGGGPCRLDHKDSFTAFHSADSLRARIVVFLSCATIQPIDGLLDPADLLATRMLSGGHTQAVVGSLHINFGTPALGTAVLRALRAGMSAGEVALQVNQLSGLGPPSFLCLGDPAARLTSASEATAATPAAHRTAPSRRAATTAGGLPEDRTPVPASARSVQADLIGRALAAGDLAGQCGEPVALALQQGRPDDHALDRELCLLLSTVLAHRGPDVYGYLAPRYRPGPLRLTAARHLCGARLLEMPLAAPGGAPVRVLEICERCGFAADRSIASDRLAVATRRAGRTMVEVTVAGRAWSGGGVQPIGGRPETPTPLLELTAGTHLLELPQPPDDVPGLRRTALVVVQSGDFEIVQLPVAVPSGGGA